MEIWKLIEDFPLYEISNHGNVRSLSREYKRPNPHNHEKFQIITTKTKIIKGWKRKVTENYFYVFVALRKENKTYIKKISHLVLENFDRNRPVNMEVCHNDGNSLNNNINNLRWDTHLNNIKDSIIHGKKNNPPIHLGEKHPNSKFTGKDVIKIRNFIYKRGLFTKLAKKYNCSIITISRIYKKESWKHIY